MKSGLSWIWNTNKFSAASRPCRPASWSAAKAVQGHEPLIWPHRAWELRGHRVGPWGASRPTKATKTVPRGQMSHCWFHRIPRGNAGLCPQREKTLAGNSKPTRIPHFDTKNRNTWLWIRGTAHFILSYFSFLLFFLFEVLQEYYRFFFIRVIFLPLFKPK